LSAVGPKLFCVTAAVGTRSSSAVQLDLPDMPSRLFTCTPSRLTTWLDCPRRYRLTYVDRPPAPRGAPWAHNSVGSAVHLALAEWWRLPSGRRTPPAAASLVRERWQPLGFRDDEQAAAWRERAETMVERYVATLDPLDEPVGIERTVAVRTPTLALSGRIDRLDQRGGELVVVDYKTGRHVLTADDARGSLALAIYAVAAARTLRRPCARVELHHLPTGDVVSWEHPETSLARHLDRAAGIAAEIVAAVAVAGADDAAADAAFLPRPGRQCGWCDVAAHCPAGRGVTRQSPWSGLAEDITQTEDISPAVALEE
jgi:RecB family exonuclease